MKIKNIVDNVNKLIEDEIGYKYTSLNKFIDDEDFRCISIYIHDDVMSPADYMNFKIKLYKNFIIYISDFIEIEERKIFNIYFFSDNYFRRKKLDKVTENIYNNGV